MASSKKEGRNKDKCAIYKSSNKRMINKKRKMNKHFKEHPNDLIAKTFLEKNKWK